MLVDLATRNEFQVLAFVDLVRRDESAPKNRRLADHHSTTVLLQVPSNRGVRIVGITRYEFDLRGISVKEHAVV